MFGHDDEQKEEPKDTTGVMPPMVPDSSATASLADSSTASSPAPAASGAPDVPASTPGGVVSPNGALTTSSDSEPGGEDVVPTVPSSSQDEASPADDSVPTEDKASTTDDSNDNEASNNDAPVDDDLMSLKQEALQQLSPLVGKLDQTPDEKFRTIMMLIQASDDRSLVKTAFESAQAITDDKARAQALLDVINEINYFTQHKAE